MLYATLPVEPEDPERLSAEGKETLENTLMPAIRQLLLPPRDQPDDELLQVVTSLEKLYRVFERC